MASYTVKGGDTLSAIAKRLGIEGGWQDLYNQNKDIIKNANLIRPGQELTYGGSNVTSSKAGTTAPSTPSQKIGDTIAEANADPTRQNFIDKYGLEEDLRPDAMFQAFGDERVNPEWMRQSLPQVRQYDAGFGAGGGYLSSRMQADRGSFVSDLERDRKEQVNQYIQSQNQLYNTWYNQEMNNFMTSKAPSDYQLQNFGIELPTTMQNGYQPGTQYQYTPTVDATQMFGYGGYTAPQQLYGTPYQAGGANDPSLKNSMGRQGTSYNLMPVGQVTQPQEQPITGRQTPSGGQSGYSWSPTGGQATTPTYSLF